MATSGGSFNQDSWNRWKTRLEGKLHFCSLLKKTSEKALSYDDGSCNTLNFQPQKLSFDFDSHSTAVEVTQKFRIQCKRGNSLSPLKKTNFHLFEGPRFSLGRISRWRVVHAPLHFDAFSFCKIQRWAKKVCPRLPDGIAQPRASFFGHLWTVFFFKDVTSTQDTWFGFFRFFFCSVANSAVYPIRILLNHPVHSSRRWSEVPMKGNQEGDAEWTEWRNGGLETHQFSPFKNK